MGLPVLKWAGGKRFLADRIVGELPEDHGTYYEPFVGGAAVFFRLTPKKAVLSDTNKELINFYLQLQERPRDLFERYSDLPQGEVDFYEMRSWIPDTELDRAARFYYLTSLSFNGIYRVNLRGEFNVPFGNRTRRSNVTVDDFISASSSLMTATILAADFESAVKDAGYGDVVYFDPPYTLAHNNNGFVKYNEKIFSWGDQERLAATALSLMDRGCTVIVSNAAHETVADLYPGFRCEEVQRQSVIASRSTNRRVVSEYLFIGKEMK